MPRWIWILIAVLAGALFWAVNRTPEAAPYAAPSSGGGEACPLVPLPAQGAQPVQVDVPSRMQAFRVGEYRLQPLAGFGIEARVLAREDYRFDAGAALSPTDLALGWGDMANPAVYRSLAISQSGRWYHYRWGSEGPPLPLAQIIRSSANMHLVPADESVARAMSRVKPDQTVRIQGWLIEAKRDDGWGWRSSLTREDSGDGSCELIYVCAISSY